MNHPLAGYFCVPHDCPPKWLFMFTAYVDETGHELERGWTFLAGFLGNEDQWKNFVPECGLRPIMAGSRLEDYVDLVSDKPYEKQFKSYLVCLHVLVIQVLREIPDDETLEIVFEEQRQYEPWANLILAIAARVGPKTSEGLPKLAKWSFVPKGSPIMTEIVNPLLDRLNVRHAGGNTPS